MSFDYAVWAATHDLEPLAKHGGHNQADHGRRGAGRGAPRPGQVRRQARIDRRVDRELDRVIVGERTTDGGLKVRGLSDKERANPHNRKTARRNYRRRNVANAAIIGASAALVASSMKKAGPDHDAWLAAHGLAPLG